MFAHHFITVESSHICFSHQANTEPWTFPSTGTTTLVRVEVHIRQEVQHNLQKKELVKYTYFKKAITRWIPRSFNTVS